MVAKRSESGISNKRQRRSSDSPCPAQTKADEHDAKLSCSFATVPKTTEAPICTATMQGSVRVAVLVPFRDNYPAQQRRAHLDEFVPYMTTFLHHHCTAKSASFHTFILEQSLDGCKFNRGKLLNAGFDMTRSDYDVYIFHDVDLLPGDDLSEFYTSVPHLGPMHIARVWERYSESSNYFGGIVAFTRQHFIRVNGFPNNFWGWGGEDNELYSRVVRKKLTVHTPTRCVFCFLHCGTVRDLEAMSLEEKLTVLRRSKWKCTVKHALLKEHHRTWKKNGLKNLCYEYMDAEAINEHCTKITVKLGPNGHWSDSRSSLEHPTASDHDTASYLTSATSSEVGARKSNGKEPSNAVDSVTLPSKK